MAKNDFFRAKYLLLISVFLVAFMSTFMSMMPSFEAAVWKSCCAPGGGCDKTWCDTIVDGVTTWYCCQSIGGWTTTSCTCCTDSDGGNYPKTAGTCTDTSSHQDSCSGTTLTEYYCSGSSCTSGTQNCDNYDCTTGTSGTCSGSGTATLTFSGTGDDYSCSGTPGYCKVIGSKSCSAVSYTCDSTKSCQTQDCSGVTYKCYRSNSGSWKWGTSAESTETACTDGYDNDCDGKTDCVSGSEDTDCSCGCTPGVCDTTNRKYCLSGRTWSTQDSTEYCSNCAHCIDGSCNCGETILGCPSDCPGVVLSFNKNPQCTNLLVTPTASNVPVSYNGYTINFRSGSCTGSIIGSCQSYNGGCDGPQFSKSAPGTYSYFATIDMNGNGVPTDTGECDQENLVVNTCEGGTTTTTTTTVPPGPFPFPCSIGWGYCEDINGKHYFHCPGETTLHLYECVWPGECNEVTEDCSDTRTCVTNLDPTCSVSGSVLYRKGDYYRCVVRDVADGREAGFCGVRSITCEGYSCDNTKLGTRQTCTGTTYYCCAGLEGEDIVYFWQTSPCSTTCFEGRTSSGPACVDSDGEYRNFCADTYTATEYHCVSNKCTASSDDCRNLDCKSTICSGDGTNQLSSIGDGHTCFIWHATYLGHCSGSGGKTCDGPYVCDATTKCTKKGCGGDIDNRQCFETTSGVFKWLQSNSERYSSASGCSDGIDNDCDGDIDCSDRECCHMEGEDRDWCAPNCLTCTPTNPTVSISPSSQSGTAGSTKTYTATVTNQDSTICSASLFSLTTSCPSGWTCSVYPTGLSPYPGDSSTSTLTVTSSSSASAGDYTVSVTATRGSNSKTGSAIFTVTSITTTTTTTPPSCNNVGPGTPIVRPSSPIASQSFKILCPFDISGVDCGDAKANGNTCDWAGPLFGWEGNNAVFNCPAMPAGSHTATCKAKSGTGSNCCDATTQKSYTIEVCNNNGVCDFGEDCNNCPNDCNVNYATCHSCRLASSDCYSGAWTRYYSNGQTCCCNGDTCGIDDACAWRCSNGNWDCNSGWTDCVTPGGNGCACHTSASKTSCDSSMTGTSNCCGEYLKDIITKSILGRSGYWTTAGIGPDECCPNDNMCVDGGGTCRNNGDPSCVGGASSTTTYQSTTTTIRASTTTTTIPQSTTTTISQSSSSTTTYRSSSSTTTTIPCDSTSYTTCALAYNFGTSSGTKSNMCGAYQYYKVSTPVGQQCDISWDVTQEPAANYDLYAAYPPWITTCPSESNTNCKSSGSAGLSRHCAQSGVSGTSYAMTKKISASGSYGISVTLSNCITPCTCTWSNAGCGVSPCSPTQMKQTSSCVPAGCDPASRCVDPALTSTDQGCGIYCNGVGSLGGACRPNEQCRKTVDSNGCAADQYSCVLDTNCQVSCDGSKKFTLQIYRGWNLISIPCSPINVVNDNCGATNGNFYMYDAETSEWNVDTVGIRNLNKGVAYWFYSDIRCTVNITGSGNVASSDVKLFPATATRAWNYVGSPAEGMSDMNTLMNRCMQCSDSKCSSVEIKWYDSVANAFRDVSSFGPGQGYQVKCID